MIELDRDALIRRVAFEAGFTIGDIKIVFDTINDIVEEVLLDGGKIKWSGFCTAYVGKTKAYNGWNPVTKEPMSVPEKYKVYIRPSKKFINQLNKSEEDSTSE